METCFATTPQQPREAAACLLQAYIAALPRRNPSLQARAKEEGRGGEGSAGGGGDGGGGGWTVAVGARERKALLLVQAVGGDARTNSRLFPSE